MVVHCIDPPLLLKIARLRSISVIHCTVVLGHNYLDLHCIDFLLFRFEYKLRAEAHKILSHTVQGIGPSST